MSKNRTKNSKYPSRYSPNAWVTAAQYLAEYICENRAKYLKRDLPIKFWDIQEWRKYYTYQITLANKLLKKFDESDIIGALCNHKHNIWSLGNPLVNIKIIEFIKKKNKNAQEEHNAIPVVDINQKPREHQATSNIIDKLKELE